jgi:hypothetical protein
MHRRTSTLALIGCMASLGLLAVPAWARQRQTGPKTPTDKGPNETRGERDKRLQRECKGKPNAGACEGYAN